MRSRYIINVFFFLFSLLVFTQQELYTSYTISDSLSANANAVIRSNDMRVSLKSSSEMHVVYKRIITVLNKQGNDAVDAYVYYDNNIKIKELQAIVYNALGVQIKKIKKSDFKDVSAVSGGTLYSDSRVKYLEYTPIAYPYTVEFTTEIVNENTAFIRPFRPIDGYNVSAENSTYSIIYPPNLEIRTKEKNFELFNLEKTKNSNEISYKVKNLAALESEMYGPTFFDISPMVLVAATQFSLEGVESTAENWNDFGKWMYKDLIMGTDDLPQSTILKVQELVKNETTDLGKAKKIYQYVQDKTRYISVQVGIGGWKPFNTSEVDRLGYGDCKALSNYTMALLKAVGVKSNYVVLYAGQSQRSFEKDFAAMMGNHAILNIPMEDEDVWLECTNQKVPFGFIGNFTDDRDVLVVTPEGGKIVHTKKYEPEESVQHIQGSYDISNEGYIQAKVKLKSKGIQYNSKYSLESETERELDKHYKNQWGYINSISINEIHVENNKETIEFMEEVSFQAPNYSKIVADRMLLPVNAFNRNEHIPDRYRNRKFSLKVKRGFTDLDEVEIKLPSNYKLEALPKNYNIENKFGHYKAEVVVKDESTLIYKREFVVKDGEFPKEDYKKFRDFHKAVARYDNSKIALIKNQPN
ncbi:DUF3857 domain-containing transglutaminase family protein [uncultured Algibacter sp.]|uniref:DUF3857 domain-containing transglutaminase family protein n=1 Tax=uncultured Algibacter sp. TaxID=298659 RepID=UPI002621E057|nr:DUF3857 domain-containing transglutaminase family protein [uncultured Algibacter sp.]